MKIKKFFYSFILVLAVSTVLASCCQQPKTDVPAAVVPVEVLKYVEYPADALKIVATITLKNAAFKTEFEAALKAVVEGTNTEEGNIAYEAHLDTSKPLVYVIIEVWKDQAAIDFHNETPHFKAFVTALGNNAILNVNTMKKIF